MLRIPLLCLAMLAGTALPHTASAEFFHGVEAAQRHDGASAVKELTPLAEAGEIDAQNELGVILINGLGVPADHAAAAAWFRRAAEGGLIAAMDNLATLLSHDDGALRDPVEAAHWYEKAAARGDVVAMEALGAASQNGIGMPTDSTAARGWFLKAAEAGSIPSMFLTAKGLLGPGATPEENQTGRVWLQRATAANYPPAQDMTALAMNAGLPGYERDQAAAAALARKAADQGDPLGASMLGEMYRHGLGVPASEAEAGRWFEQSAQHGGNRGELETARLKLAANKPKEAFFWTTVLGHNAPEALWPQVDDIHSRAAKALSPADQAAQTAAAAAWHPQPMTWSPPGAER